MNREGFEYIDDDEEYEEDDGEFLKLEEPEDPQMGEKVPVSEAVPELEVEDAGGGPRQHVRGQGARRKSVREALQVRSGGRRPHQEVRPPLPHPEPDLRRKGMMRW